MTELNESYQQRYRFFDKLENYIYNDAFKSVSMFDNESIDKLNKLISDIENLYESEHKGNYS